MHQDLLRLSESNGKSLKRSMVDAQPLLLTQIRDLIVACMQALLAQWPGRVVLILEKLDTLNESILTTIFHILRELLNLPRVGILFTAVSIPTMNEKSALIPRRDIDEDTERNG